MVAGGWLGQGREELQRKGRETLPGFWDAKTAAEASFRGRDVMGKLELSPPSF